MQAATEIVNPANILGEDAMFAEKWTHAKIVLRNRGDETRRCLEWLVERRLIHNSQRCGTCNENCKLNRYQQGIYGDAGHVIIHSSQFAMVRFSR